MGRSAFRWTASLALALVAAVGLALVLWEWSLSGAPATATLVVVSLLLAGAVVCPFILGPVPEDAGPLRRRCMECSGPWTHGLHFCLRCGGTRTAAGA